MCQHKFMDNFGDRSFKGAEAVRLCVQCDHAEAFVDGEWINFNEYLESLGPNTRHGDSFLWNVTSSLTERDP